MSSSPFRKITIAGGTGTLGYHISNAFLDDGSYSVKILRRKPERENEKANKLASKGAEIVYADYSQKDDLVKAIKGTDVLISVVGGSELSVQSQLLAAAKEAQVKRFIPSEFGGEYKPGVHPYVNPKAKIREEVEKSGLEYTYIFNGLFQEYLGSVAFDVKNKKATFYKDGNTKLDTTSLPDIAKYTVESLKLPESRNAVIRVSGAVLTLNEYLELFEKASGSKWEVVEDKDVRHRFRNNIEPVPTLFDDFKVVVLESGTFEKVDNDKFSFTPRPVAETINDIVKQA